jgi:hypothetical protein
MQSKVTTKHPKHTKVGIGAIGGQKRIGMAAVEMEESFWVIYGRG